MSAALGDQVFSSRRRSVVRTLRQPANVVFPLVFPLMLLAVNSGGLDAGDGLPGFPTHSIVAFLLAVPFIQGALFATMNTGTDLARDIQTGFMSRLSLTPMRDVALLVGQLGGIARAGPLQARRLHRRRLGGRRPLRVGSARLLVLLVFSRPRRDRASARSALFAALRTGSGEAVQGLFPVVLRLPVPLVDGHPAQPDRRRLVPHASRRRTRSRT